MIQLERKLKCVDSHGFIYEVTVKHEPMLGFSTAYYDGRIIGSREYGKCCYEPTTDSDRDWEEYEQRLNEHADEIETDLKAICEEYFNNQ